MILEAITYFLQALTYFTIKLTEWEVSQGVTLGSIIIWYLCVIIILWIIGRIVTGQHTGGDNND